MNQCDFRNSARLLLQELVVCARPALSPSTMVCPASRARIGATSSRACCAPDRDQVIRPSRGYVGPTLAGKSRTVMPDASAALRWRRAWSADVSVRCKCGSLCSLAEGDGLADLLRWQAGEHDAGKVGHLMRSGCSPGEQRCEPR